KENSRLAEVDKLRKILDNPAKLDLKEPPPVSGPSERRTPLNYRPLPADALRPASPAFRRTKGPGRTLSSANKSKGNGREVRSVGAAGALKNESPVAYTFDHEQQLGEELLKKTSLTVKALYRGQVISKTTDVTLYYRADTIVFQKPPPN